MTDFIAEKTSQQNEDLILENTQELNRHLTIAYHAQLDEEMGKLHNQFSIFISTANLPLPQTLLVLQLLVKETVDQAFRRYLGE